MISTRTTIAGILNTALSVFLPFALAQGKHPTFATGEAIVFGFVLFIFFTVAETALVAEEAFRKERRNTEIWEARETPDQHLQEVRRLYHQVVESVYDPQTDLYVQYFLRKISDLEKSLREACSKREIRIDETMLEVTTWLVDSAFDGDNESIFRAVHYPRDNAFFADVHTHRYFQQVYDRVRSGKIVEVRRLIVNKSAAELNEPFTQRLMRFHQATTGYSCRTLTQRSFDRIVSDYALDLINDFGIFGDTYLYRGIVTNSDKIIGTYSKDADQISRYVDFFETCWDAGVPPVITSAQTTPATVEWLFAEAEAREGATAILEETEAPPSGTRDLPPPRSTGRRRPPTDGGPK